MYLRAGDRRHFFLTFLKSLWVQLGMMLSCTFEEVVRLELPRELSQTVLGHTRLLDLLRDPRLSDICTLDVQANGQAHVFGVGALQPQCCSTLPPGVWSPVSGPR